MNARPEVAAEMRAEDQAAWHRSEAVKLMKLAQAEPCAHRAAGIKARMLEHSEAARKKGGAK